MNARTRPDAGRVFIPRATARGIAGDGLNIFCNSKPHKRDANSLKIKNARFEVIHLDGLIVSIELDRVVYEIASFTMLVLYQT